MYWLQDLRASDAGYRAGRGILRSRLRGAEDKESKQAGGRMVRQASIGPEVDYDIYLTLIQVGRDPQVDMC